MTIHEKTYFVAACDSCGVEHDGGEYSAWADAESAYEAATSGDWGRWKKQDDGRLFCWDCRFQPGGDSFEPGESTAPEGGGEGREVTSFGQEIDLSHVAFEGFASESSDA